MTTDRTPLPPRSVAPVLAALAAAVLSACASAPAPAPAAGEEVQVAEPAAVPGGSAPSSTAASTAASASVTCYYGPSRQILADGSERTGAELLLRLTFEPEASRIVEQSVRFDPLPNVPAHLYTTLYAVDGASFTLEESEGQYVGTGSLEGEPWDWTGWTSDYTLQSGIRVTAEYDFGGEDGGAALHVERRAYGPDGTPALTIVEELEEIGAEECSETLARAETDAG